MILVQAHTPTFPPNNPVDAFSLLCQVAFYNCSTMEKLITVDLESWLIDRASVLIASLLPGASEMAVNASHMTSVFWHSEKNTLLKLFTWILVERRHVYLGVFWDRTFLNLSWWLYGGLHCNCFSCFNCLTSVQLGALSYFAKWFVGLIWSDKHSPVVRSVFKTSGLVEILPLTFWKLCKVVFTSQMNELPRCYNCSG